MGEQSASGIDQPAIGPFDRGRPGLEAGVGLDDAELAAAEQVMLKATVTVLPGKTSTVRGLSPCTRQLPATSLNPARWLPAAS